MAITGSWRQKYRGVNNYILIHKNIIVKLLKMQLRVNKKTLWNIKNKNGNPT